MVEKVIFKEFISKLNRLGDEDNKNDFILNYNRYKNEINKIDEILNEESNIDENKSIPELLNLLNKYEKELPNIDDNIDIKTFKKLNDLIELINNKINDENMEINEIK